MHSVPGYHNLGGDIKISQDSRLSDADLPNAEHFYQKKKGGGACHPVRQGSRHRYWMKISVISAGKKHVLQAEQGANLMECLNEAGLMEGSECGGRGVCGKCVVRVLSGTFADIKDREQYKRFCKENEVLACNCTVTEDAAIEMGYGRDDISRKVRLPGLSEHVGTIETSVSKVYIEMTAPTLHDQLSDIERILAKLPAKTRFSPSILHDLPSKLRKADFKVTCTLFEGEVIAIEAGDTTSACYGCIIDIGTTTVAMYLVDLLTGSVIDARGLANPQRVYGADVLSRITVASTSEGLAKMQDLVRQGIRTVMHVMCADNNIADENVYQAVVVGNTSMSHFFLGVDPANLAVAPFVPCYRQSVTLKAAQAGLSMNPEGYVHVLANISGYVGSDTIGVAMATKPWEKKGITIAVDIGTNGEIILGYKGWVLACSAAAGPAFEGAHIEQGMRAGEGAIERVSLKDDKVTLGIIGDTAPQGICGSGLIDVVAELITAGLITRRGSFVTEKDEGFNQPLASRLRTGVSGIREFVLAYTGEYGNTKDIVLTQKDVRELQLAKAAIAAGIEILVKEAGFTTADVDRCYLAGAFGNYLDKEKAVVLGLFPGIPQERIIAIGNAAAEGAGMCLLSASQRKMSDRIASFVKPVELSTHPDFNDKWIHCLNFPRITKG